MLIFIVCLWFLGLRRQGSSAAMLATVDLFRLELAAASEQESRDRTGHSMSTSIALPG